MQATFRPPVAQPVEFAGPAGLLEALVEDPTDGAAPAAVGVVCHPHPLYGGTMQNKVVHTLARAMQELGVPTLRFNFRGVGRSAGRYAEGVGEAQDALAAIEFARRRWRREALWLGGFSFGAAVAFEVSVAVRPERLVTVAPPVARMELAAKERPGCPWLIVQGDEDELVDTAHNLNGQLKDLQLRRIVEGESVYFIGEVGITGNEILVFDIEASPADQSGTYKVQLVREFYAD